ncbi:nucleotidyltransferase domain-containing protein [Candidatus Saccharibacteria bacterium]|nr:nucleotidyltransferase domain-containing protein [Candidatus Saccharibacteria bacterium]
MSTAHAGAEYERRPETKSTPETRERSARYLDAAADAFEAMRREMPEVIGLTAFGSTVRGEAGPESDADVYLYVETSDTAPYQTVKPGMEAVQRRDSGSLEGTYEFNPAIAMNYKWKFYTDLKERGIPKSDIVLAPINDEIITSQVDEMLDYAAAFDMEDLKTADKKCPRNVRGLFHAPVQDEGLKGYRDKVLARLVDSEHGEKVWMMISHFVEGFERRKTDATSSRPDHRTMPRTLGEAIEHYNGTDGIREKAA